MSSSAEMLQTAAAASKAASTTTLKRRIRQRLHKKLGGVFSKKDFALAMERFKLLEAEDEDREPMPFEPEAALLSGSLPVRFTFIHFSTPARRKRSHSAALPEVMMSFLWAGGTCWRGWHDSQIMRVLPSLSAAFRGQV
ncbi:unnamed protein product [Cladocopium goreaui]|uniref:Uncharacterized protein n=1 Tax=Cladocopium goreaui TaxID=2562237 RepID=A0A9P1GN61_9DINO|nr:unnamed protein product [Cladocopium goreaui]